MIDSSQLPDRRGNFPDYISAGTGNGEFLVSSRADKNNGVMAITVATDTSGNLTTNITNQNPKLGTYSIDRDSRYKYVRSNLQQATGQVIVEYLSLIHI